MTKDQLEVLNTVNAVLKCVLVSLLADKPHQEVARVAGTLKHFSGQSHLPHVQAMLGAFAEDCAEIALAAVTSSAPTEGTAGH